MKQEGIGDQIIVKDTESAFVYLLNSTETGVKKEDISEDDPLETPVKQETIGDEVIVKEEVEVED